MGDRPVRGVLLMTHGSPATLEREDVRAYLARIRGAREPDTELVDEYRLGWQVEVGMRFSEPTILAGLQALADTGVRPWPASARRSMGSDERRTVRILITAHSLPRRVAEQEPDYLDQLRVTARAVATRVGLADDAWTFCWQSAGHEPGEWMKPDVADLMPEIAAVAGDRCWSSRSSSSPTTS
jgi:protoheme ferro-lyase